MKRMSWLEGQIALETLFRRYPKLRLALARSLGFHRNA